MEGVSCKREIDWAKTREPILEAGAEIRVAKIRQRRGDRVVEKHKLERRLFYRVSLRVDRAAVCWLEEGDEHTAIVSDGKKWTDASDGHYQCPSLMTLSQGIRGNTKV